MGGKGAHLLICHLCEKTPKAASQIDGGVEFWCSAGLLLDCSSAFSEDGGKGVFGKKPQCSLGLLYQLNRH